MGSTSRRAPSSPGKRLPLADNRRLSDRIADLIRDAIITGVLPAGHPLRQEELAARFGISRIPLREALRQIEAEGLVEIIPYRGAAVRPLSIEEVQQVTAIRLALETLALDLAIPRLEPERLASLADLVTEVELCRQPARLVELRTLVYTRLYDASGWPLLVEMIRQVHRHGQRYIHALLPLVGDGPLPLPPLRELLDLARRGDVGAAKGWLTIELHKTEAAMVEAFTNLRQRRGARRTTLATPEPG